MKLKQEDKCLMNLNVRIPQKLKEDTLKHLGNNFSDSIRECLQILINQKRKNIKEWIHCYVCDNKKAGLNDMVAINLPDEDNYNVTALVCKDCFEEILDLDLEEFKLNVKSELSKKDLMPKKMFRTGVILSTIDHLRSEEYTDETLGLPMTNRLDLLIYINNIKNPTLLEVFKKLKENYPRDYKIIKGNLYANKRFSDKWRERVGLIIRYME